MRIIRFIAPALVLVAGLVFNTQQSLGKAEDTKKTKKACTFCHTTAKGGKADLTEAGKYYKEKGTLEGFKK